MAIALKDLLDERLKRSTSPSSGSFSLKPSSPPSIPFPQHFRTGSGTFSGGGSGDSGVIITNDFGGSSIEFLLSSSPPAHLERVPQSYRPLIPTSTPSMAINAGAGVGRKEMTVTTNALQPSTPTPPSASSLLSSSSLSHSIPDSMKSRKERKRRLRMAKFPTESETNVEDGDCDQIFHFSTSIGGAFGSLGDH